MPGLTTLPQYLPEWRRFIRSPANYVEEACARTGEVYAPLEALTAGLAFTFGLAAYEAHRGGSFLDKGTEQVDLFLTGILNFAVVHIACKILKGQASEKHMLAAFEYLYGFLTPFSAAAATLLVALTGLLSGLRCTLTIAAFQCADFPPTKLNLFAVSALQAAMLAVGIYTFVIANAVIARLHKLGRGKTAFAQAVALSLLYVVSSPIYSISSWIAVRFKDLFGG